MIKKEEKTKDKMLNEDNAYTPFTNMHSDSKMVLVDRMEFSKIIDQNKILKFENMSLKQALNDIYLKCLIEKTI